MTRHGPARLAFVIAMATLAACGDDPDKAAPEIVITTPVSGAVVATPIKVTGTVKDPRVGGRTTSGIASVTVSGVAATVTKNAFEAEVDGLPIGPATLRVEAIDHAGNAATAEVAVVVEPPVTSLLVSPPVVSVETANEADGVQLAVTGFFAQSGSKGILPSDLTFVVADPAIAKVSALGVVTAASTDAKGETEIQVQYKGLVATVTAQVDIDLLPPLPPRIIGYFPLTNQRDQTWTGLSEPWAKVKVANVASESGTVEVQADATGRFWLGVPLRPNAKNDLVVTLTDKHGNTSEALPFPVTQSDGYVDAGALHLSSVRRMRAFVGELVPEVLVARAYRPDGQPRANADVTFAVVTGDGRLAPDATSERTRTLVVRTDTDGYARARWQLGSADYDLVEVHASLTGDVGFPVVFQAEGFARIEQPTVVEGVVYDENRIPVVGLPVTILTPGTEYANNTTGATGLTDDRGKFSIGYAPALPEPTDPRLQHMRLDGTQMPEGQRHVRIDRQVTILPGQVNDTGTYWIPRLPDGVAPKLDANGVVTEAIVLERELIPGNGPIRVRVPVGTKITWPGGVPESARKLALLAIPEIRAPMSLPDGFFSREVLALQPGGTRFEPPLPLDMPNSGSEPPGAALTMWSYDHFQSKFVPIGRGIVSDDGTRVVSEAGSGIRVGAWHKVSPPIPDPPCTAKGQTITTVIKGTPPKERKPQKCKCYIEGTDQPTECPEDKDLDGTPDQFIITNVGGCKPPPPPPPPDPNNKPKPKPPTRKVEIVCEEKPLQITNPTQPESTIKRGETIGFKAECLDNHKSDGSIKWQRSEPDPKSGTGPSFTIKFDKSGTFVVSASASTKTCKGSDQRTVKVLDCAETGSVRVCGDKIEQVGPAADLTFRVSGNVRMGLKGSGAPPGSSSPDSGDQYLQVVYSDMIVKPTGATATAASMLRMEVGWPIVGTKLTPLSASASPFTVTPEGLIKLPPPDKKAQGLLKLLNFKLGFEEIQMLAKGVFLKNPRLDIFQRNDTFNVWTCPKPYRPDALDPAWVEQYHPPACKPEEFTSKERVEPSELQIVVSGVELSRTGVVPTGYFEWKPKNAVGSPGLDLIPPVLKMNSVKLGYEKNRFSGELALQASLKAYDLGIKTTAAWGEGYFAGNLEFTFSKAFGGGFELPGIPIVPTTPVGPIYLQSVGLGYESTGWPVSDNAVVKLKGSAGVVLGPQITTLGKKYSLATGRVDLSLQAYPLAFSAKGTLAMLDVKEATSLTDVTLTKAEDSAAKLNASLDVVFEPTFSVKIGGGFELKLPKLADDAFLKGNISGSLGVLATDPTAMKALITGDVEMKLPETRISPEIKLLQVRMSVGFVPKQGAMETRVSSSFLCGIWTCTAYLDSDTVNGLSIWIQNNKGDTVSLVGVHPSKRVAALPTAPAIGISAASPVTRAYEGDPLNLELLEPAEVLQIVLDKDGPVQATLMLPDGRVFEPIANPSATATGSGVDFEESLDGKSATWVVYNALPGTYTVTNANTQAVLRSVTGAIGQAPPAFAGTGEFDYTLTDALRARWSDAVAPSDARVTFRAIPAGRAGQAYDLEGSFPFAGSREVTLDDGDLPRGRYTIEAEVRAGAGSAFYRSTTVLMLGVEGEVSAMAPKLLRGVWLPLSPNDSTIRLQASWLPVDGATAYGVTYVDTAGVQRANAVVSAPKNQVTLEIDKTTFDSATGIIFAARQRPGTLRVEVLDPGGAATVADIRAARPQTLRAPLAVARVGTPWTYDACANPALVRAPPTARVAGNTIQWVPDASQLGRHAFRVGGCGVETFDVDVLPADAVSAPEAIWLDEARVLDATIGQAATIDCAFQGFGPIAVTLAQAPDGATITPEGRVTWTPDRETVIAAEGRVTIVCQGAANGLSNTQAWTLVFADRDGDGLSDDFEIATGLDPNGFNPSSADGDDDGLPNYNEDRLGTLGNVKDSDGDGLEDGVEARVTSPPDGVTATSSPRAWDSDGDGLSDKEEKDDGTDPYQADSDGDGVSDAAEKTNGTNPKDKRDTDQDGVFDDLEVELGTDKANPDTDGDGLKDGEEVFGYFKEGARCTVKSSPFITDTDADGADDFAEASRCDGITDPENPGTDQDGDGLRSDRERILGTKDTLADTDGDGVLDPIELAMGTDPLDPESVPVGVETEADELIASVGQSAEVLMAPESLTDFGNIYVVQDFDHDTAADEYELAWDYDPESPSDAYSDDDGDGLPMWLESRLGTNPRAADTDGDGVDDGQEVQDGTDPNDPTSFSTAGPAVAIVSYPRVATVEAQTLRNLARLQLDVVGTRADGTTLDLTATARGTRYTVEPANAGTVDASGLFVATPGYVGEASVQVVNLTLSTSTTLDIQSFTPEVLAQVPLPGAPTSLAVAGHYAYVGGPWGVRIIDVDEPSAPVVLGTVALAAAPGDLAATGGLVAAALGANGVAVIDVTDPLAPVVIATLSPIATTRFSSAVAGVAWAEGKVIAATAKGLVQLRADSGLDLADRDGNGEDDRILAVQSASANFTSVASDLDRVVASRADGHLVSFRLVGGGLVQEYDLTPGATAPRVALRGGVVAAALGATAGRLVLAAGATFARSANLGIVNYAQFAGDFVLATESTSGTVNFLDATSGATLATLGNLDFDAFFPAGLAADRRNFYFADAYNSKLWIASHSPLSDTLGVPPTVFPLAPLAGGVIEEGTAIDVSIGATDDIAVRRVAITRDGVEVANGTRPPYALRVKTTNVTVPTAMSIGATATDYGGNIGTMAPLTFEVTPVVDTVPPSLTLLEPTDEEWVASNVKVQVAAMATDNHAVYQVEIRLGGTLVATLYDEPYVAEITMPASAPNGRVELEVKAIDYGDNVDIRRANLVLAGTDLVAAGVTRVGPDDHAYDDKDILIRKGTVAIDGAHRFGKVRVGREGILTHSNVTAQDASFALDLLAARVDVAATGAIDVTGRGYLGDCATGDNSCGSGPHGPGNVNVGRIAFAGGTHAGVGGGGNPANSYGSWTEPDDFGMGGNYGSGGGEPGGNGGGRIRIAADAVWNEGVIRANGGNAIESAQKNGAGGAGGSIWITTTTLTGMGRIEANGGLPGSNASNPGAVGGGGRVAIYADDTTGTDLGLVRAWAGAANYGPRGGAGTVWLDVDGQPAVAVVDDGRRSQGVDDQPLGGAATDTELVLTDLVIGGSARLVATAPIRVRNVRLEGLAELTHLQTNAAYEGGLQLTAARLEVGPNATIDLSGRGYLGDCSPGDNSCGGGPHGPGNVNIGRRGFMGGSHGGVGGTNPYPSYGDWVAPVALGMGGDYGSGGGEPGGDGGGRARIEATEVVLDGWIRANGATAPEGSQRNGSGGAGGSVWLTATTLSGAGGVEAQGGDPASNTANPGSPGGGGRVAVSTQSASGLVLSNLRAWPGAARLAGREAGAGTVWSKVGAAPSRLVVDDGGRSAWLDDACLGFAPSDVVVTVSDLIVRGTARLVVTAPLTARNVTLEGQGRLSHLEASASLEPGIVLTAERLEIGAEAAIDVTARGYLGDCHGGSCGPGGYTLGNVTGGARPFSGGSYGGLGAGPNPNPTYGDAANPGELGSGGGYGSGGGEPGGDGGGRVVVNAGTVIVDGEIAADGGAAPETAQKNGSGGSGGAIKITATALSGTGRVHADGGAAASNTSNPGAHGGGGRVALLYGSGGLDATRVTAYPGRGEGRRAAAAGTVWIQRGSEVASLVLDDGGFGGGDGRALGFQASDVTQTLGAKLVLRGTTRLALAAPIAVDELRLEGTSVLTQLETTSTYEGGVSVTANVIHIASGAAIDVSGRGYLGDCAAGASCGAGARTIGQRQDVGWGARQAAGGSHGGQGYGNAGRIYGDPRAPLASGGGGGYGSGGGEPGGDGGGRVRLVTGRLDLDGAIRANGFDAIPSAQRNGAGGAGGSVYVTATTVSGAGAISVDGGSSDSTATTFVGGGGGGGRIALVYQTLTGGFDVEHLSAKGGTAANGTFNGGAGTVWLDAPGTANDRLVVDNGGLAHGNEVAPWVEVGNRRVLTIEADGVTVSGAPWIAGELAGLAVTIDGEVFTVSDNTASALTLTPVGGLARVAVGSRIRGERTLSGRWELRGAGRVALADRAVVDAFTVSGGAVLTHAQVPSGGPDAGLWLKVLGTATVASDGRIDVSGRGYFGDCHAGAASCGAGGATLGGALGGARQLSGGSHGGLGGGANPGFAFGDYARPVTLGGGGGYGAGGGEPGGNGGGRVWLEAARLVNDGFIAADGEGVVAGPQYNGGGGAGGAILIDVDELGGAGHISANGGDSFVGSFGAGGGGGRVALVWDADFGGGFDVDAVEVRGGGSRDGVATGGPGTLWLEPAAGVRRLVIDNGGVANGNECAPYVEVGLRTVGTAQVDRVVVPSAGWPVGALVGAEVVFGAGTTRFTVASNTADTLVFAGGDASGTTGLALRAFRTIAGRVELHGGARVALDDRLVANAFIIDGDAVLTHRTTTGSDPERGLWVETSGAFTVAADGKIDVSGRGYRGDCAAGSAGCGGGARYPGGATGGARQFSGGSFGGLGGGPTPNAVYGDLVTTWLLGAGGGYGAGGGVPGGAGGGRVKLVVGSLTLAGAILADGFGGGGNGGGGGAGGGVDVTAVQLTGAGTVSAKGGNGETAGGGGGGGRIHLKAPGTAGTLVVTGGAATDNA
ncbi:MAG: hypothetical protein JNJ59_24845, partial [Deltaproteobacteria bacterium]|nr:hypothetical protein [Deltaproteobacteria bacterium]